MVDGRLDPDLPAMAVDDPLHNGQPGPYPLVLLGQEDIDFLVRFHSLTAFPSNQVGQKGGAPSSQSPSRELTVQPRLTETAARSSESKIVISTGLGR